MEVSDLPRLDVAATDLPTDRQKILWSKLVVYLYLTLPILSVANFLDVVTWLSDKRMTEKIEGSACKWGALLNIESSTDRLTKVQVEMNLFVKLPSFSYTLDMLVVVVVASFPLS